ncbi:MAG TPA: hypothetical protein VFF06_27065 [Polyangia bacterium]|nr:hypothetical protein [Polyangia bacterium]
MDRRLKKLWKRLHRDEGGNIIVLYIAAALLLVGMLWAIIGTGARMVQKETIQSSADAAAFSAAVIKAKGMNIIAFCNLVMAVLLAIIMLLRLIKGALIALVVACTVSCALAWTGVGGVLCPFEGTAIQLEQRYSDLEAQLEPRIMDAMKGLAKLERVVNKTFPALSLVEAYRVGTNDAYKKNMGKGSLVTVTWPLPVGADFSLPTKDGTWKELCDQAVKVFGRVLDAAMTKMGLGFAAGAFSGFVMTLLSPLEGILCGSGGGPAQIEQPTNETDCSKCSGATSTILIGQKRIPSTDGVPSHFNWQPGQKCKEDYFDSSWCGGKVQWLSDCNGGSDQFQWSTFDSCIVKEKTNVDLGNAISGDKPLPLDLSDDWQQHNQVRAFTMLTDTAMADRRQSVNVAVKPGQASAAPMFNELLGTAQSEFFAFNGHEDLWHMNWRARLVRFTFPTSLSGGDTSAASGGPSAADSSTIANKVTSFLSSSGGAALGDQFLLH